MNIKHGLSKSSTYSSYKAMKERCLNIKHKNYRYYSKVGICQEWLESFEKFYSDMGERPVGTTLDRIDNKLGYFKENCRWATKSRQSANREAYSNTGIKNISRATHKVGGKEYIMYHVEIKRLGLIYRKSFKNLEDALLFKMQTLEEIGGSDASQKVN